MKGIVKDLDKGFYEEARRQQKHPLALLTDLVAPEPPEIAAIESRLRSRVAAAHEMKLGAFTPALNKEVSRTAYLMAGLEKEMGVRGISGSDTVEMAFFSSANGPNQPLFPVFLAAKIIAGKLATSLVPMLSAANLQVTSHVVEKVTISDSASTRQLKTIDEGVDLPKTTVARTNGSIQLKKYGRMLEATYEAVRLLHLDILGLQMMRMGQQIGIDQTDDLLETLEAGDGNTSTAITLTNVDVTGTMDYDDIVKLFLAFPIGYTMRHAVLNDTNLRTLLNLAEFKDPQAGGRFPMHGDVPGAVGATWHRWTSTGAASFASDHVLAVDSDLAAVTYSEGDLLEESDQLIDKQMHRRTMSEWFAVAKWDVNASQGLNITI